MTSKIRLLVTSLLPLLPGLALAACSDAADPEGTTTGGTSGGTGTTAGSGVTGTPSATTGGTTTGGATTGATSGGATTAGPAMGAGGSGMVGGTTGASGVGGAGVGGGTTMGTTSAGVGGAGAGGATSGMGGTTGGGTTSGSTAGGGIPDGAYPVENVGADCTVSAGSMANNPMLPDPFAMHDGTRISSLDQWACRRNEIKKDIEQFEIGPKPEPPQVAASMSGNTLNVEVTTDAGSITLTSNVSGQGSDCVVIGMDGNSSLVSGCVQVPFTGNQVVNVNQNGMRNDNDPFYKVYPDLKSGKIGNYVAWSWGISRLIDGLDQLKDDLGIDMTKIAVHGCSYAGKMALFAGAFDERIALTIAQESGGGGINSWRTSQDFVDRTGTNIEKIDNTNYSWFMPSMQNLNPDSLPHDHHELIAMIAPRAVIALGNRDYEWLGDESGFKSINAAMEVWKAMGIEDRVGYDFTTGHGHCQAPQTQKDSVNAFVNKFLKGQDADTNIRIDPPANGFDLDYTDVIDWETPSLQ